MILVLPDAKDVRLQAKELRAAAAFSKECNAACDLLELFAQWIDQTNGDISVGCVKVPLRSSGLQGKTYACAHMCTFAELSTMAAPRSHIGNIAGLMWDRTSVALGIKS